MYNFLHAPLFRDIELESGRWLEEQKPKPFVFHIRKDSEARSQYGTAIVLAHLLVNIVHGAAHRELHVELRPAAMLFVIGVILLCPLIAMVLLWVSQEPLGLALSMAASLIFGLYKHFAVMGAGTQ